MDIQEIQKLFVLCTDKSKLKILYEQEWESRKDEGEEIYAWLQEYDCKFRDLPQHYIPPEIKASFLKKDQRLRELSNERKIIYDLYQPIREIETQETAPPVATYPPESTGMTIEQAEREVEKTIALLLTQNYVIIHPEKKIKDKVFPAEYWLSETVKNVLQFLETEKQNGTIQIGDCKTFMVTRLRGKKGGKISNSFYTQQSKKV